DERCRLCERTVTSGESTNVKAGVEVNQLIVFYDGICGLCNRLVQFLLKRDRQDRLRFASLQSDFASRVLSRHGIDPRDLDTVHVVEHYQQSNERVLDRSDAILRAGRVLGGIWAFAAKLGSVVP